MLVDQWPYGVLNDMELFRYTIVDYKIAPSPRIRYIAIYYDHWTMSDWCAFFSHQPSPYVYCFVFKGYDPVNQFLVSNNPLEREFFAKYIKSDKYKMANFPMFLEESIEYYKDPWKKIESRNLKKTKSSR